MSRRVDHRQDATLCKGRRTKARLEQDPRIRCVRFPGCHLFVFQGEGKQGRLTDSDEVFPVWLRMRRKWKGIARPMLQMNSDAGTADFFELGHTRRTGRSPGARQGQSN